MGPKQHLCTTGGILSTPVVRAQLRCSWGRQPPAISPPTQHQLHRHPHTHPPTVVPPQPTPTATELTHTDGGEPRQSIGANLGSERQGRGCPPRRLLGVHQSHQLQVGSKGSLQDLQLPVGWQGDTRTKGGCRASGRGWGGTPAHPQRQATSTPMLTHTSRPSFSTDRSRPAWMWEGGGGYGEEGAFEPWAHLWKG